MMRRFASWCCALALPSWLCACSFVLDTNKTSQGGPAAGAVSSAGAGTAGGGAPQTGGASGASGVPESGGSPSAGRGPSSGGSAGEPSAGGADPGCPCRAPTPSCRAGACTVLGPSMVEVSDFYIDSTEVTVTQYAQFLADAARSPLAQRPECDWNQSFEPAPDAPSLSAPTNDRPVTNV